MNIEESLNTIMQGDSVEKLAEFPAESIDLVFADPPYNLQLQKDLYRPNQTRVDGVFDTWDQFDSLQAYDAFTRDWLKACRRVLKKDGAIWVIGSYHNIYRVGAILQELGFWFLNDVVWIKTNPMPNFRGTRFNNAHETLLWAAKSKDSKVTFHYKAMKSFNDDLQMRSDWYIPVCSGNERVRHNGQKAHSTQKPAELLYRVLLSTTNPGDVVLDPFMGSGTTGVVAKQLGRRFIGIEKEQKYVDIATERISHIVPLQKHLLTYPVERKPPRVPFGSLIEKGFLQPGDTLYSKDRQYTAKIEADASLTHKNLHGSIHKVSAALLNKQSNNGWKFWYALIDGEMILIDTLRQQYIETYHNSSNTRQKRQIHFE